MKNDSSVEANLIELLRCAISDAERRGYDRGVRETMAKIQNLVFGGDEIAIPSDRQARHSEIEHDNAEDDTVEADEGIDRKRAPKGLVRKVIVRTLSEGSGQTVQEIEATAKDDLEKMIKSSSYRSELRKGRDSGLYHEDSGRWYLIVKEKTEERPQSSPSAFGSAAEGG